MNPNLAMQSWGLMLQYLPIVVVIVVLCLLSIVGILGSISGSLKEIVEILSRKDLKEKDQAPEQQKPQ